MSGKMKTLKLGRTDIEVSALGLGCMGLSEFYGEASTKEQASELINYALDNGVNFFDTADTYGHGHNEELLAYSLKGKRGRTVIATKFGIVRKKGEYARVLDGRPEYVRKACHDSLKRLNTDYIDLYYIHRLGNDTPVEETVGELSRLVEEGKIRAIGMSEVSKETLEKACAVHPVTALQTEYSMFTRDPEQEILPATREMGITFVPYSPICRGLLSSQAPSCEGDSDFRSSLPRFSGEAYENNLRIAQELGQIAENKKCSLAQLSLAWVMSQSDNIVPIPGTTKVEHLKSNIGAAAVDFSTKEMSEINSLLASRIIIGQRYTDEGMKGLNA
jgi:aryl-alcohol dehydrogenase-like predicted oxidoreductase